MATQTTPRNERLAFRLIYNSSFFAAVPPLKGKGKGKEGAAAAVVVDEEDVLEREEAAAARAEEALAELRRDADQEATLIAGEVRKVASQ